MPRTRPRAARRRSAPSDLDPGVDSAEQRTSAEAADGDHRAERDDHRADPQSLDQHRIDQRRPPPRCRWPRRSRPRMQVPRRGPRCRPWSPRPARPSRPTGRCRRPARPASCRARAPAPTPSAAQCSRRCPSVPKTGEVSENSDERAASAATSIACRDTTRRREAAATGRSRRRRALRPSPRSSAHWASWTIRLSRSSSGPPGDVSPAMRPSRDDEDAVGERQHLRQVGRDDDHRLAGRAPAHRAGDRSPRARRRRRRASARSARRARHRRDASARAAPSAGCRPESCADRRLDRGGDHAEPSRRRPVSHGVPPPPSTKAPSATRSPSEATAIFSRSERFGKDALLLAVLGQEADAGRDRILRRARPDGASAHRQRPGVGHRGRRRCRRADLVLAGAEQAGQRHHLARADVEAHVARRAAPAEARDVEARASPCPPPVRCDDRLACRAPTIASVSARLGPAREVGRGDFAAVAQHGGAVAEVEHLGEAVRHVEDGDALRPQAAQDREEALCFALRRAAPSARRGSAPSDRAASALAISTSCRSASDRRPTMRPGECARPSRASAVVRHAPHRADVEQPASPRLAAERDVLRDRQVRQEAQLLIDGGDAELDRVPGAADRDRRLAAIRISPAIGCEHAGEDVDQRRLAGAVLADQSVDLAARSGRARRRRAPARRESAC